MDKVLDACIQLPLVDGEPKGLQEYLAESVRKIFSTAVSGILVREKSGYSLAAVSSPVKEGSDKAALLSHVSTFATQAIDHKRLLSFKISYEGTEREKEYHGVALPLVTVQSHTALVAVRSSEFSAPELSAFNVLGNTARLALDRAELTKVCAQQGNSVTQLMGMASELGSGARLRTFLPAFAARLAEFLGFERAGVAMIEPGGCRLRWSSDSVSELNVDLSSVARRILEGGVPVVAEDVRQLPVPERNQLIGWDSSSRQYMGIPLIAVSGQPLGLLAFLNKKQQGPITAEEVRRARGLCSGIVTALESAQTVKASEQHKQRAEDLMQMALELGSALRLPDFIRAFTERVCRIMGASSAILALAQGSQLESVGFYGANPEREILRRLNASLSDCAGHHHGIKISTNSLHMLDPEVVTALGWKNVTLVRLEGTEGDLLALLALANFQHELQQDDLNLLQALIVHASVALENSRLFTRITQSSRQWAEIFDSISDFIVVHDEQYQVMRVNRSLAECIGVRPAELIGLQMCALTAIISGSPHPCPFCHEQAESDEYLHPVDERSYLVSTSRIHGALDEGFQTVHVLKDITDRREAERRYRELFDNVQEGVFFASPEGHFIEVNDALVRMLGYESREEVLKLDLRSQVYISPGQRAEILRRLNDSGAVRNYEVALCRRDGSLIHALENTFVVRDAQDRIMQYRGVFLDITEVKNFQAQLQRERDFSGKILNNTQTMIMVADTAGLISYANRRCYEAGDFQDNQLVGQRLDALIAPNQKQAFVDGFESALRGTQADNLELMMARGSGQLGKFSVNLSPMRDEAGDVTSVVVLMTDITDTSLMQAKLMHTEKMAAVGQLVSGVAHEVNNPLTAIMGFSDLLMENPEVPGSARKDLQVILEEAQRTKEIVQNLLSFARQRPPQRQRLQINSILRKTIALRAYDFSSHGVQVLEKFDETLPELIGDSHQLQQVFLNILNNAYDAVRATHDPGSIEIQTMRDGDWVEVLFRDNGEGIRNPERIFDPFFTTKEVGQGTGLGLSICYGIVREHEGEILCANNQDTPGATFSVRLPIRTRPELKVITMAGARL
jgi:two-component system NtrC family sensor kinase